MKAKELEDFFFSVLTCAIALPMRCSHPVFLYYTVLLLLYLLVSIFSLCLTVINFLLSLSLLSTSLSLALFLRFPTFPLLEHFRLYHFFSSTFPSGVSSLSYSFYRVAPSSCNSCLRSPLLSSFLILSCISFPSLYVFSHHYLPFCPLTPTLSNSVFPSHFYSSSPPSSPSSFPSSSLSPCSSSCSFSSSSFPSSSPPSGSSSSSLT